MLNKFRFWYNGLLIFIVVAMRLSPAGAVTPTANARYMVTFESTWSLETHPQNFPSNPHFSSLIGGTHTADVVFWEPGMLATRGIQNVAEQGSAGQLRNEVTNAIEAGTALEVISGGGIRVSPGSVSTSFSINQSHPLVTLVTMIAPSPDWFIGVHGLNLFQHGRWAEQVMVDVLPYDSGTDSGTTYTSLDVETIPPEPIFRLDGPPFLVDDTVLSLGTLTFRRTDLLCNIELSQTRYVDGETLMIDGWQLANLASEPTELEVGIWLDIPGAEPISVIDDVFRLASETTESMGPQSILTVTSDLPRGTYEVGCRVLDPVTKLLRYEAMVPLEVE